MVGTAVEIIEQGLAEALARIERLPALRLCFLGAAKSKAAPNEERRFDAAFSVFIVTEAKARGPLGVQIGEWVVDRVILWPVSQLVRGAGIPRDLRFDALYTSEIDQRGIALHAVSWVQSVRLGLDEIDAGPHDPTALGPVGVDLEQTLAGGLGNG
ncbi:hypothetical protein PUH89_04080 [Rhodobacter capsulatus]|uniref:hypothetical protein n=1 Tax=Rhodobacter capsulatus TaxID=1061 RepID=UPI0023E27449|nr:hypothetical protein [Rhodobacter capsulatus]WER10180.1 hypothetical protein PUH89_04080 [Rhodobacter capsulatus]